MLTVCGGPTMDLTADQIVEILADHPEGWWCCYGSATACEDGPAESIAACSCWTPVYDLEQSDRREPGPPKIRPEQCGDCAYRASTAERPDLYVEQRDRDRLFTLGPTSPFYCHDGMRRAVAWEHPQHGIRIDAAPGDYRPPQAGGLCWRADGSPALLCAGWAAINRADVHTE